MLTFFAGYRFGFHLFRFSRYENKNKNGFLTFCVLSESNQSEIDLKNGCLGSIRQTFSTVSFRMKITIFSQSKCPITFMLLSGSGDHFDRSREQTGEASGAIGKPDSPQLDGATLSGRLAGLTSYLKERLLPSRSPKVEMESNRTIKIRNLRNLEFQNLKFKFCNSNGRCQ